jgi:hypothetical protein
MSERNDPLELDLTRHCIETAIRLHYDRSIRTYFKQPGERRRIANAIERLLQALETLDFPALRDRYPVLNGHTASRIALVRDPRGRPAILVDGRPLPDLPLK